MCSVQMLKFICQPCTPLITGKQLWVIGPLICQCRHLQFSQLNPPCSRYSDVTRNISSPLVVLEMPCKNRFQVFSRGVSIFKTHIGHKLRMSTNISRLIKLHRKFLTDANLFQKKTIFDICRHVINTSRNCEGLWLFLQLHQGQTFHLQWLSR